MQLPMDFRLASDTARFGFVFARRGIVPEAASSWFLPRLVGMQQALEWCMTGRVFNAAEALNGGLVRSVHAPTELLAAARALAREIADNTAPVSIALTRAMLWRLSAADHRAAGPIRPRTALLRLYPIMTGNGPRSSNWVAGPMSLMTRAFQPIRNAPSIQVSYMP